MAGRLKRATGPVVIGGTVLALTLAGCASPITSGTVVGKRDTPAHYETVFIPISTGKTTVLIPELLWISEDWQINVRGGSGQRTGWVDVSQRTYDRAAIGRQWRAGR